MDVARKGPRGEGARPVRIDAVPPPLVEDFEALEPRHVVASVTCRSDSASGGLGAYVVLGIGLLDGCRVHDNVEPAGGRVRELDAQLAARRRTVEATVVGELVARALPNCSSSSRP